MEMEGPLLLSVITPLVILIPKLGDRPLNQSHRTKLVMCG
jgi:hypothetical protein